MKTWSPDQERQSCYHVKDLEFMYKEITLWFQLVLVGYSAQFDQCQLETCQSIHQH